MLEKKGLLEESKDFILDNVKNKNLKELRIRVVELIFNKLKEIKDNNGCVGSVKICDVTFLQVIPLFDRLILEELGLKKPNRNFRDFEEVKKHPKQLNNKTRKVKKLLKS